MLHVFTFYMCSTKLYEPYHEILVYVLNLIKLITKAQASKLVFAVLP